MSIISVRHAHRLSQVDARKRVDAFEGKMSQYGIHLDWNPDGSRAEIKNMFVKGHAELGDGFVLIHLKLGLLARSQVNPEQLEGAIRRRLDAAFAEDATDDA
jgi:putative polyhydroxyalkanoate system protein